MKTTGYILKSNRVWLEKKIAKLNKKATRLGCEPITLLFTGNVRIETDPEDELRVTIYEEVTMSGEYPHIKGWDLVAIFQRQSDTVFVRNVPDREIPGGYYSKETIECQHCGYNRRRKKSYLLLKDSEYKEVGSTCVKSFFDVDVSAFLFYAEIDFSSMLNEGRYPASDMNIPTEVNLEKFLSMTARCIDEYGWVSKGKAFNDTTLVATVEHVDFQLFIVKTRSETILEVTEDNKKQAIEVIEYFKEINPDNNYLENCKKIADSGYLPINFMGIAASMVATYRRAIEEKIERESRVPSEWIGAVKERITVEATVTYINSFHGQWGPVHLHKFNSDGNQMTWFASRSQDVEVGDKITLTGTVKKHDTYKDNKVTALTRCKMVKI